jgi:hypothetical protein
MLIQIGPARSKCAENPPKGNNSRISSSKSSILPITILKKCKYENLIKIKNKPDPALFGTSYLSY